MYMYMFTTSGSYKCHIQYSNIGHAYMLRMVEKAQCKMKQASLYSKHTCQHLKMGIMNF